MNEKKIPTWNLWGEWLPWVRFPPHWLGLQIEGSRIPKPLGLYSTNPGGDKKTLRGGLYCPKRITTQNHHMSKRRSLSHLNCYYLYVKSQRMMNPQICWTLSRTSILTSSVFGDSWSPELWFSHPRGSMGPSTLHFLVPTRNSGNPVSGWALSSNQIGDSWG